MDFNLICLGVIDLDSALNKDGKCYPQKVIIRHITEDIEMFSDNSNESVFFLMKD